MQKITLLMHEGLKNLSRGEFVGVDNGVIKALECRGFVHRFADDGTLLITEFGVVAIEQAPTQGRALTYLTHHAPLTPEANEPDFKMQRFGKLLNRLDRQPAPTVHERGERLGVDASGLGNRRVRPRILPDGFPQVVEAVIGKLADLIEMPQSEFERYLRTRGGTANGDDHGRAKERQG